VKKVLIFSLNYYPRFIGGAEVAIKEITDRIDPSDIEFHMVTLRVDSNLAQEEKVGNVIVHRIGPARPNPTIADLGKFPLHILKHWYQFGAFFAALRLNRKYHFDGSWAMMAHSTGIPAGLFKTFCPRVKYLLTRGRSARIYREARAPGLASLQARIHEGRRAPADFHFSAQLGSADGIYGWGRSDSKRSEHATLLASNFPRGARGISREARPRCG
jgi:hypothetical protein